VCELFLFFSLSVSFSVCPFLYFSVDLGLLCNFVDCKFLYFAYGSNLLAARIHIQNPSAIFQTIARLNDYRLDFDYGGKSSTWQGAAATVTSSPGDHVWGVLWSMDKTDLSSLDNQEGVQDGIYEVSNTLLADVFLCCL